MLIRYKKNMEKIAMGLLSFMPEEKDVKKLQDTIQSYESDDNWHLYLWREDDILGAIGLRLEEEQAIIQHISVNPSHRNSGLGNKMIQEVQKKYQESYTIQADKSIESFFKKCIESSMSKDEE
ncbi:MAG TPA: GNAT family N-acetyltransferase [Bacillota bacterium]|nr:GNAT family N-acetyltransferase [Bacillota bacterium]